MKRPWPTVRLGEVLQRSEEAIEPQADKEYREITVKLWGKGVIERGRITGAEISGRRFVARTGQFIASRIDARNGAMGLVPASLDGALVTNDFPLFNLKTERLEPAFLGWLCRTADFVELCLRASEGTTNRVRLKEERFLALEIPLPSLAEQRRVVARIEELAAQIHEARTLRHQAAEEAEALTASASAKWFEAKPGWQVKQVGEFCESPQYGYTESASQEPVGQRFLRITDIQDGRVNWNSVPYCRCPEPEKYLLKPNDLVFARTGATTGKSFVIRDCPEAVFASYLIRLRVRDTISVDYLYRYFQSPSYWEQIADEKEGTGQPNLNGSKLAKIKVPIAPPAEQRRIVAELDALQAEVDALKELQRQTSGELDALLPAILDRAFRGELR
jgi:type I restriction enzyme, S subunit